MKILNRCLSIALLCGAGTPAWAHADGTLTAVRVQVSINDAKPTQ